VSRILLVDDDHQFAKSLQQALLRAGHDVTLATSAQEATSLAQKIAADLLIIDYQLPDGNGVELLDVLMPAFPGAVCIVASAYPDVEVAVEAMKRGAFDYVVKSPEIQEFLLRIERGAEVAFLRRRAAEANKLSRQAEEASGLIGESPPMKSLRTRLEALTSSDDTIVFISGETGTGKGVVARTIHAKSKRTYEPFVAVDCTTVPVTLVESELFGYEKGAFSGAVQSKIGRVEAAGKGTLFLDEIGELELGVQAKLLRLLEEKEFTRVGGTRPRQLQARIMAATNRNLQQAVLEGKFRADLRYRLEVFVVEVPPLRDRGDDLFLLAGYFMRDRSRNLGRREPKLHADVIALFSKYPFPGNVRELRNMIEQAILLSNHEELTLDAFPVLKQFASQKYFPTFPDKQGAQEPFSPELMLGAGERVTKEFSFSGEVTRQPAAQRSDPDVSLQQIRDKWAANDREQVVHALKVTGGNVSAAARQLNISRYQLLRRLKKYGLQEH